jgi:hypothetical protein
VKEGSAKEGWTVSGDAHIIAAHMQPRARRVRQYFANGSMIFREVLESIRPRDALARESRA